MHFVLGPIFSTSRTDQSNAYSIIPTPVFPEKCKSTRLKSFEQFKGGGGGGRGSRKIGNSPSSQVRA